MEERAISTRYSPRRLLLGGASQLGYSLVRRYGVQAIVPYCSRHSRHPICESWPRVNLDDADALRRVLAVERPDIVIHCGGICDVDRCESQPAFAWAVNYNGTRVLLEALSPSTHLVYCSSDHVFGGDRGPYRETDPRKPVSIYGKIRCATEDLILRRRPGSLIVRHGLGIGPSLSGRSGHLDWLRYRTRRGLPTTVVADEVRSAVWSADLAGRIWELAHAGLSGVRHVVATHAVTRPVLARFLNEEFGIGATLALATRRDQAAPHIGDVELATAHSDRLAAPLPAVGSEDGSDPSGG